MYVLKRMKRRSIVKPFVNVNVSLVYVYSVVFYCLLRYELVTIPLSYEKSYIIYAIFLLFSLISGGSMICLFYFFSGGLLFSSISSYFF